MRQFKLYQVDAFTSQVFGGNPAAVVPLENSWPADELMQSIAEENNLAETAFILPLENGAYHIRWFTPKVEVDLCGHATLAAAWVIGNELLKTDEVAELKFDSRGGALSVLGRHDTWTLDFPAYALGERPDMVKTVSSALMCDVTEVYEASDLIAVLANSEDVLACRPDLGKVAALKARGVVITAVGGTMDCDFVSRFFAPACGINEDPVTGSAHCELMPYWSKKLGNTVLKAKQLSSRGGEIACELKENRVLLTGNAVRYMKGEIWVREN